MKPDEHMPFSGSDFFTAMEGQQDFVTVAYLRLLWYYWSHNHCSGLRDDDEFLRRIARVERSDWHFAREILFDNNHFFTQDADGLWHQKRAETDWKEKCETYEKNVQRGRNGAAARWGKSHKRR